MAVGILEIISQIVVALSAFTRFIVASTARAVASDALAA